MTSGYQALIGQVYDLPLFGRRILRLSATINCDPEFLVPLCEITRGATIFNEL